jgi:FKBP-type peptidyl-prolyl cis-trans isomerase FkpA
MKKLVLFILSGLIVLSYLSCAKGTPTPVTPPCTNKSVDADASTLLAFAGDSIPLTHDSTGLYYHIVDSGNATKPNVASILTVTYTAQLMDKTIFDSATNSNLQGAQLSMLIPGWIIGMPKIGVGGRIQLFIPSALAWGCNGIVNYATGAVIIPPDAPVYFDVTLLGVN